MKLKFLLTFLLVSASILTFSQNSKTFAITGSGKGDFLWMNIRQIDIASGLVTKTVFDKGVTKFKMVDATTNIEMMLNGTKKGTHNSAPFHPTANMIAAAAYDKKHNKLFFAPMFLNELRWLDLTSDADNPTFYFLKSPLLNFGNTSDEANNITRMTVAADGNGYALTNAGNHLIKFTTGKKIVITDLGGLLDASSNKSISVHNKCSSWGGDIVADAFGKLYLFTASKNIFKIDIAERTATHLGSITGLSGAYTLNGAAVDDDDNVIISSANTFEGFFKVSMKDLKATKIASSGTVYNSSDLANNNLLFSSQLRNNVGTSTLVQREVIGNRFISVYPNPVAGTQFQVTFENNPKGEYNVALTDIQGKLIMNKQVFVISSNQVENIQMKNKPAGGMYLIKVTNANKRSVFSDKIVMQ